MRDELRNIEEIESYLNGSMALNDRAIFETKMLDDSDFKDEVQLQKLLIEKIQFLAFKSEVIASHAVLANTKINWWKNRNLINVFLWGFGLFSIALILFYWQYKPKQNESKIEANPNAIINNEFVYENESTAIDSSADEEEVSNLNTGKSPSKKQNQSRLNFQKKFISVTLNADLGGTITTEDSKSKIYFEPNMLIDKNGNKVNGDVIIKYREFRNQADMAFSKIPMNYQEGGNDYRFNSVGMIEIRAYQNNEELKIKPGTAFRLDMNVVEQADSCYFFALNDENNNWEKKQKVDFDSLNLVLIEEERKKNIMPRKYRGMLQGKMKFNVWERFEGRLPTIYISLYDHKNYRRDGKPSYAASVSKEGTYTIEDIDSGKYIAEINCDNCDNVIVDNLTIYADKVSQLDGTISFLEYDGSRLKKFYLSKRKRERIQNFFKPSTAELQDSIMNISDWAQSDRKRELDKITASNTPANINLIGKAHLVQGLRGENFGVYNCDQIQLVKNQVAVKPSFIDANGQVIENIYALSMIDLNINAAFSFLPTSFKCERDGKIVLLAFSGDKLYGINANQFKSMNITTSGKYIFKLDDLTSFIQSTDDLQEYLNQFK